MYNIAVQRFPEDPEAQGVIRAQDGSWQLVIDNEGFPHLWLRVKCEKKPGQTEQETGMVPIEMFMAEGMGIRDIMLSEFGGEITDEKEIAEAEAEWDKTKDELGIPCPK